MAQDLVAYLSSDFTEEDVLALRAVVTVLHDRNDWSRAPPQFVDETDDSSCTAPEDEPIRTVGVVLPVFHRDEIPGTPVGEPERVLDAIAAYSRQRNLDFEVQLGDTYVGEIRHGEFDRLLRDGLLARW